MTNEQMCKWNETLTEDLKRLDRSTLMNSIPTKKGMFTVDPNIVISEKLTEFNSKYGTNITRENWLDRELPNRNDMLLEKLEGI